ncbi:MAG: hypothetical protein Q7S73_03250 [bacterium]|nr:hypothetical protein [bacterium]
MDQEAALKIFGPNFIDPKIMTEHLGAQYSQKDLEVLSVIPLDVKDAERPDPYDSSKLIKDIFVLYPTVLQPTIMWEREWPFNFYFLFKKFGFVDKDNRIIDKRLKLKADALGIKFTQRDSSNVAWAKWFEDKSIPNHPIHRNFSVLNWRMMRKSPPPASLGLSHGDSELLAAQHGFSLPSLLDVLVMISGYYFSNVDSKKPNDFLNQPFWENRDDFARLLSSVFIWTLDECHVREKLIIGLNDAAGGIYIDKQDKDKISKLTGVLPLFVSK